ncbi:type IV pilus modification protein PilV [Neptunomonas marina]|uniref:Type IV pilus modification protein PilV n=2 Tax=Neptunomonas marina TaxID=1815562 RepID=A0A437Q5S4_9GAMM|nr:type IV pilus modification protein PilV [Neptunomonas marina]
MRATPAVPAMRSELFESMRWEESVLHEQTALRCPAVVDTLPHLHRQRGVGLLEVLITVLVLSVGLVGMATLMFDAVRLNTQSYQRTIAINLAYDMSDRIRSHQEEAEDGDFDHARGAAAPGNAAPVDAEITEWLGEVANQLPGGQGAITTNVNGDLVEFEIAIWWDEDRDNANGAEAVYNFLTSL